jgi:hypothetical protein
VAARHVCQGPPVPGSQLVKAQGRGPQLRENLITDPLSSIAEYKDAVNALVVTARKMGLK